MKETCVLTVLLLFLFFLISELWLLIESLLFLSLDSKDSDSQGYFVTMEYYILSETTRRCVMLKQDTSSGSMRRLDTVTH